MYLRGPHGVVIMLKTTKRVLAAPSIFPRAPILLSKKKRFSSLKFLLLITRRKKNYNTNKSMKF